jgi:hypothetical protein
MRLIVAVLVTVATVMAGEAEESVRVLFTGKLLGYTRTPDVQRFEESPCQSQTMPGKKRYIAVGAGQDSQAALQLSKQIEAARRDIPSNSRTLLVGMGDNFAMDYLSRVVVLRSCDGQEKYRAKDELVYWRASWWDLAEFTGPDDPDWKALAEDQYSGQSSIAFDNVARFFRKEGYAALVPGKHDFYYGPERLRHLGRLLETGTGQQTGVAMLGANLVIRTKFAQARTPQPEFLRQRTRKYAISAEDLNLAWKLPKTVLPWLRRIWMAGSGVDQLQSATICEQEIPDQEPNPGKCQPLDIRKPLAGEPSGGSWLDLPATFHLEGELSYLACVTLKGRPSAKFCQPFSVASPFFQYPDWSSATKAGNTNLDPRFQHRFATGIRPYVVDAKSNSVIFGVVSQGMEKLVGVLNTQWLNLRQDLDTSVETIDPGEALSQMLQFCEQRGDCHVGRTYILLAQMPRDAAAVLNRAQKNRFQLVIAQADNRTATAAGVQYPAGHPPLVVVPPEVFESGRAAEFETKLPWVDLTVTSAGEPPRKQIKTAKTGEEAPAPFATGLTISTCLHNGLSAAWERITGQRLGTMPPSAKHFQLVLLEAMRKAKNADVALLQDRDLFELATRLGRCQYSPVPAESVRASIEQILWKGDFVMTRTIKGSALVAALARSKELKATEDDVYSIELEKGRWLLVHGAVEDPAKKQWYINGQPLENNTLYSVAMTDFLAFGDTGYPELGVPATPPVERPRTLGRLPRIAELMLESLGDGHAKTALNFATYLDRSSHLPFLEDPPMGFRDHMSSLVYDAWTMPKPSFPPPNGPPPSNPAPGAPLTTSPPPPPTAAQRGVALGQSRNYWRFFLDKAEFGYSSYQHNRGTQQALKDAFSGIPESGVLNRQKSTWASAFQFELRREWARSQWFARFEEEYTKERTQQDREFGTFLLNYPLNSISGETGVRLGWSPTMRRRPWFAWLLSVNGSSQFRSPFLDLVPGIKCGPAETVRCPDGETFRERTTRTSRWLGKVGLSWQGQENWLEGGLFYGRVLRPVSYTLVYDDPAPGRDERVRLNCDLASDLWNGQLRSLSKCFSDQIPVASGPVTDWNLRSNSEYNAERGLFLNFNLRWDLPRKKVGIDQFFVEHRGRWFFNTQNDLALDTRISSLLKLGPTLKLFPSLNLKPTFSLFHFQNRIGGALLRGRTFEFKIEYRFNRKSGDSWRQALKSGWPK